MLVAKAGAVYENLTLGAKAAELTDEQTRKTWPSGLTRRTRF